MSSTDARPRHSLDDLLELAARVGFDWPDTRGAIAKVREELAEVEAALAANDADQAREEVGDLLFAAANLARRLKADPEQALRATNDKFEWRFRHVEWRLAEDGHAPGSASLEEMDRHWEDAKRREKNPTEESLNE